MGTLGLGSSQTNAYSEKDMRLLPRVAKLVAVAVENALTHEALVREKERLHMLLEVNNTLVTNRDLQKLFPAISGFHPPDGPLRLRQRGGLRRRGPFFVAVSAGISFDDRTGWHGHGGSGERHARWICDLMERETKIFTREDLMGIQSSFVSRMLERRNPVALLHSSDHPQG